MFIVTLSKLGAALPQKVRAATLPVQLYYSQRATDDDYGIGHVEGYIAVQNLAYDKKLTVHYSLDGGKTWTDGAFGQSYVYTHKLNTGAYNSEKYLSFYVATKNLTN